MTDKKKTGSGATELDEESMGQAQGRFRIDVDGLQPSRKAGKVKVNLDVQKISDGIWKTGPV